MDLNKFEKKNEKKIDRLEYPNRKKVYAYIANYYFDNGSEEFPIKEENIILDKNIDFIWTDSREENNIIFVKICNRKEIIDNHFEIVSNIRNNRNNYKEYIENIEEKFDDEEDELTNKYILINADDKDISNKDSIINELNDLAGKETNECFEIINLNDINNKINIQIRKDLYIKDGEFELDQPDNFLKYSTNNKLIDKAIVCNISAKSLKENYDEHGNNLLNLNLRYFKKTKAIDQDIEDSIKEGSNFWFLNNGLYIICDSFKFIKNKIKLTNFSIINGGQTTYNISHTDFNKDFYIICKIVSIKNWTDNNKKDEAYEFANKIAIASNKQKPIKNKDLIANKPIINKIKEKIISCKHFINDEMIFCESKNGEFSSLKEEVRKMYKKECVKSIEFFIQLAYSWNYILPGTGKSGKAKIYNNQKVLDKILENIFNNIDLYLRLIWVNNRFKNLEKLYNKTTNHPTKEVRNMLKYFDFYMIVFIRFIVIFLFIETNVDSRQDFCSKINSSNENKDLEMLANEYDIDWKFINTIDTKEFEKNYLEILKEFSNELITICENAYGPDSLDQCHNLVKNDTKFIFFIRELIKSIRHNTELKNKIKRIIKVNN